MATVHFKVLKHHKKSDGTINVKLVVYHKGKRVYPDTPHFVTEKQLTKKYEIKDQDLIAILTKELAAHRLTISKIGSDIRNMTASQLGEHLMPRMPYVDSDQIDFIAFGWQLEKEFRDVGQDSTANGIRTLLNNFTDFTKLDVVYTSSITADLLKKFEKYLRKPHIQQRSGGGSKISIITKPGISESSLSTVMSWFKLIYKSIMERYNDEDQGILRIRNYPFRKYKVKSPPQAKKRAIPLQYVKYIRDCPTRPGSMAELSRDMFMLSFYLCGMNAKDIFLYSGPTEDRISYKRSKTRLKRKDDAYISIRVVPESKPLLDKYIGKLDKRYSSLESFRGMFSQGNANLKRALIKNVPDYNFDDFKLDFYAARHTFATEARNTLGFSVSDIGEALNHAQKAKITDTYIVKDWGGVDKIQAAVVGLLKDDKITSEDL